MDPGVSWCIRERKPTMSARVRKLTGALLLGVWMAGAGCSPDPMMDVAATNRETSSPSAAVPILESADEDIAAIRLVREAPAADGWGTNEDWAKRHLDAIDTDVFFPRWQAARRAAGRYEVTFTYTVVNGGMMTRRGFVWTADVVLKLVSPVREMTPEELMARASRLYRARARQPNRSRIDLLSE